MKTKIFIDWENEQVVADKDKHKTIAEIKDDFREEWTLDIIDNEVESPSDIWTLFTDENYADNLKELKDYIEERLEESATNEFFDKYQEITLDI